MWDLYKDDFAGKGLPGSLKTEWLLRQAGGNILLSTFLLALLIGTTYYAHQYLKRNSEHRSIFSGKNMLVITLLGLAGFYYTSFLQPGNDMKSRMLLADIVYTNAGEPFQRTEEMHKTREVMTLPELYHAKDSIARTAVSHPEYLTPGGNNPRQHELRMYDFKIMQKIAFPFTVVLFYIMGILVGISFRKTIGLVSLLISYFLVYTGWSYGQSLMKQWFNQEKTNAFMANFGMLLLLLVVAIGLFLLLKKYGFYKSRPDELSLEFTPEPE
jgi:hypothetical protein